MKELIVLMISAILVDNVVLSQFKGICPFLGVSKKVNTAFSMSIAVILVMVIATAVTYPIYYFLLLFYLVYFFSYMCCLFHVFDVPAYMLSHFSYCNFFAFFFYF